MCKIFFCFILLMSFLTPVIAAPNSVEFHKAVYALYEKLIAQHTIRTEEEKGKYEGASAARYSYVDTRTMMRQTDTCCRM